MEDKSNVDDICIMVDVLCRDNILRGNGKIKSTLFPQFLLTRIIYDLNKFDIITDRIEKKYSKQRHYEVPNIRDISNLWKLKEQPFISTENLRIDNIDDGLFDLQKLHQTHYIVDLSTPYNGRDIDSLRKIATQVSTIFYCCSGFDEVKYLKIDNDHEKYVNEVFNSMKIELSAGLLLPSIAGESNYIKSIALSHQIGIPYYNHRDAIISVNDGRIFIEHDISKIDHIFFSAAAKIHAEWSNDSNTKKPPIIICTPPFSSKHKEILDSLIFKGADGKRIIFTNTIVTINDVDYWDRLLQEYKCYLCIDSFGFSSTFYLITPGPISNKCLKYPTDDELVDVVLRLCGLGHQSNIILSLSIFCKIQLSKYGGYGYDYLERIIKPKLIHCGCSSEVIDQLTCSNLLDLLNWRLRPEQYEVIVDKLTCYYCGQLFIGGTDNHYSKFSFDYCSSSCLTNHRKSHWKKK